MSERRAGLETGNAEADPPEFRGRPPSTEREERQRSVDSAGVVALACMKEGNVGTREAQPEVLTVMNPVSRPVHLRLAALVSDKDLDTMYQQEWGELAVSHEGRCYLVYRRRDGGDYAIEWSPNTNLPATMMTRLSEPLAAALLGGDGDA